MTSPITDNIEPDPYVPAIEDQEDSWILSKIVLQTDYGDRSRDYGAWKERIRTALQSAPPQPHISISFKRESSFAPLQIIYNWIEQICRRINAIWKERHIHVQEIIPGVFLGDIHAFRQVDRDGWLRYGHMPIAKIDTVVTCLRNTHLKNHAIEQITIPVRDRKEYFYDLVAHASTPENPDTFWESKEAKSRWFSHTFSRINAALDAGHNVLIHCRGGVSRSPTVLTAYLMNEFGVTHEEALNYVKSRRRSVNPNEGFVAGLKEYGAILTNGQ